MPIDIPPARKIFHLFFIWLSIKRLAHCHILTTY
uniref:Uncharacterized protein n=1 Tax=Rhizophora mucronata TaxID=61149 RepID=A0A2P2ITN0_RHIMU